MPTQLPADIAEQAEIIAQYARKEELDFYPTLFEMLDSDEINQVAAYGGFPQRYPHWRFGMEYEKLRKQHSYGLGRIYEMVINNDPCYAYLLKDNTFVDQKTVIAHVYAPLRLLQKQHVVFADQPADDGRDGQPRHPRAALHLALRH